MIVFNIRKINENVNRQSIKESLNNYNFERFFSEAREKQEKKHRERKNQREWTKKINSGLLDNIGSRASFENVSPVLQDFRKMVFEDQENEKVDKEVVDFFRLIPDIHLPFVNWKIKKQFNGSKKQFVKKHSQFLKQFTKEKKALCDNNILFSCRAEKRSAKKEAKLAILHSAQLLGLLGRNGKSYVTNDMLDLYKQDIEDQEAYLTNFRLVNKKGKFYRLQTVEAKQRKRNAQILNLSSCLSQMAEEKGFTWVMITYTLPPSYHCNPTVSKKNSYSGVDPATAKNALDSYWRKTRALLAKAGLRAGDHYFGASVFEVMKDSTLHKHALVYIDKSNVDLIRNIVNGVALRSPETVNFDIIENGLKRIKNKKTGGIEYVKCKTSKGATYIYKYIMKFNGVYTDDNTLRNQAARYFYSARGFDFFGVKSSLTKFNYLTDNWKRYSDFFSEDLKRVLSTYNLYEFIRNYERYFHTVRGAKKEVLFVEYDLNGNRDIALKDNFFHFTNQRVIIRKRLFCVFEVTNEIRENDISSITDIEDINDASNIGIATAYRTVVQYEEDYNSFIKSYKENRPEYDYITNSKYIDNECLIIELAFSMKPLNNYSVTVDLSYSSKRKEKRATQLENIEKYFHIPEIFNT